MAVGSLLVAAALVGTLAAQRADAASAPRVPAQTADRHVSDAMAGAWANFARTGDPNGEGLPAATVAGGHARGPLAAALPASYEGDLPCADCAGIRHHLDLLPDKLYFLRVTYAGAERRSDTVGSWTLSRDGTRLILVGARRGPPGFGVEEDAATLRWLKREGAAFGSGTDHLLKRSASFQPVEPRASMTGMYRYFADSGAFTPCGTRRRLPVAQEGDNAALEAAYGRLASPPRGEVLASLDGRIVMPTQKEGSGVQPTLVVEHLNELRPGESCDPPLATVQLEDTYWKLTRLGDAPVMLKERQAEPNFVLRSQDHRVAGNAGCNRMAGQYTLSGDDKIEFGKMVATRMACLAGMDIEQTFLAALGRVTSWHIEGQHLELFDAGGQRVARFEARALK